jgi:hypothetical protein
MEFADLQALLPPMVILTVPGLVIFLNYRKKQRGQQRQRVRPHTAWPGQRSIMLSEAGPLEYALARELAAERPLEPLAATPTVSEPPTVPHAPAPETETTQTVTIQMTSPADGASPSQAAVSLPDVTIDAELWERLLASVTNEPFNPEPVREKPAPAIAVAPAWPTGMIEQPVFQNLLDGGELFSGLVVSIGINESDSSMWHSRGLMQSVGSCIAELLREKDFSCRTAYDEFIVVCRGEGGAESQRRLNHISERLWNYQLRGIGACSILFSWGGVQVQDQPLAEAVASAVERMRQTKRTGSPSGSPRAYPAVV